MLKVTRSPGAARSGPLIATSSGEVVGAGADGPPEVPGADGSSTRVIAQLCVAAPPSLLIVAQTFTTPGASGRKLASMAAVRLAATSFTRHWTCRPEAAPGGVLATNVQLSGNWQVSTTFRATFGEGLAISNR